MLSEQTVCECRSIGRANKVLKAVLYTAACRRTLMLGHWGGNGGAVGQLRCSNEALDVFLAQCFVSAYHLMKWVVHTTVPLQLGTYWNQVFQCVYLDTVELLQTHSAGGERRRRRTVGNSVRGSWVNGMFLLWGWLDSLPKDPIDTYHLSVKCF